jgi:malyl-CoA/(S)-citramalyl-CoA lyase
MLEKAPTLGADVVFLDLEDAVAPDDKEQARENVIQALSEYDWSATRATVRINGLDTYWCYRDIVDTVEAAGDKLDALMVPKVGGPEDVYFVATLLSQIEQAKGFEQVNIHVIIETAKGMANVEAIAQACPGRLKAMVFGSADYAASTQARTTNIGAPSPEYAVLTDPDDSGSRERHWNDQWHFAIARLVAACRAYDLLPVDGPFGDVADSDGYLAAARRAATLGCEGKWAIHPSQIALANEVFSPSEAEVDRARRIVAALEEAAREGKGAVTLDGRLIDAASLRMAENLVAKADLIGSAATA